MAPRAGPDPLTEGWQHGADASGDDLTHSLDDLLELGAGGHTGTDLRCIEVAAARHAKVDPMICQAYPLAPLSDNPMAPLGVDLPDVQSRLAPARAYPRHPPAGRASAGSSALRPFAGTGTGAKMTPAATPGVPTMPSPDNTAPVSLFYSYAHEDETLREELAGHLKILERRGLISAWHDRQIVPGQAWGQAIDKHLTEADLVLLLVSTDFIGSDYIWGVELAQAMQRQQAQQCEVVPIIVRAVDIDPADADDLPFLKLQALPPDLKPVTSWANRDEAWTQVAKGLRATVGLIRSRRPAPKPPAAAAPVPTVRGPAKNGGIHLGAPAPSPVVAPPRPPDAQLDRMVNRFADSVDQAQQQRGGPPLYDHYRYQLQRDAQALIDRTDAVRVLWVDDLPDNNLRERAMLAKLQIEVVTAQSTDEALAHIQADALAGERFDLVLSDWSRPPEGAQAATHLIQTLRAAGQAQPVIVYHGEMEAAPRQRRADMLKAAGALGEAVMPAELLALVQRALSP